MANYHEDDLMSVLLALEERIMQRLKVATFGIITNVNSASQTCGVKSFPIQDGEKTSEFIATYSKHIEADILPGAVVVVLFADVDFRRNLQNVLEGSQTAQKPSSKQRHTESNGVIVQVFQKQS